MAWLRSSSNFLISSWAPAACFLFEDLAPLSCATASDAATIVNSASRKAPVRPFPAAGVCESLGTLALNLPLQAPHLPGGQAQLTRGFGTVYSRRSELLQDGILGKLSHK